ncbi:MAG: hypothetical protein PVH18_11960 [Chloroflexota bacterium]
MTKRRRRRRTNTGGLKALLLTASVIATIGGARLLALEEAAQSNPNPEDITIVEPASEPVARTVRRSDGRITLDLKPIPQAVVPRINPIASAHSSM